MLVVGVLLVVLATLGRPPVVDEESYLFLAAQWLADPSHPYAWERSWQPWNKNESFAFAHPPTHWIWLAVGQKLGLSSVAALRAWAALPSALIFAGAVTLLCARLSRSRELAMTLWLTSPVTVLALASGLMIDLSGTALATAGIACWREGLSAPSRTAVRWIVAAGCVLGLACFTKYPHLAWVLLICLHAHYIGRQKLWWQFAASFGVVWGIGQAWLFVAHGGFHPWAVLMGADQIERSETAARTLGTFVRLGLVLPALLLCLKQIWWKTIPQSAAIAGVAFWVAPVPQLSQSQTLTVFIYATLGALWFLFALTVLLPRGSQRDSDRFLLGAWCLIGVLSIPLFHNFASTRYLLPVVLPFALLASRGFSPGSGRKPVIGFVIGIQAAFSAALLYADTRFANAQVELADQAIERFGTGQFTGEWAFRWRLEAAGWEALGPEDPVTGTLVAIDNAAAREIPEGDLRYRERLLTSDQFFIRLTDPAAQAGYYGETLGVLPFALSKAPLEGLRVYEKADAKDAGPPALEPSP